MCNYIVRQKNLGLDKKWSMLSVDYYKNLDEIILNSTYNNLKLNTNY